METEININTDQDQEAVKAVREGDADRYRELVQRHERRVFAVAWSRLGNATLAEDAAQEAFIRGYQRLWLLDDGARFCAWITAITRNVAINCGLRHRRELNKRERWALEQTTTPGDEITEVCSPETLRQALAELPAGHRECLVLFYLEGRSGAGAAATLGISEIAFRVRLHRAKAALRQRLEKGLAESLEQLRPPHPLGSKVMGTILSSSSAKVAGGGSILAKLLANLLPLKLLSSFFLLMGILPSVLLSWLFLRMEQRNYRFAKGFRVQLYRELSDRNLWGIVAMMLLMFVISLLTPLWSGALNKKGVWLFVGILLLFPMLASARRLAILRNRFQVSTFISSLILTAAFLTIGSGLLPTAALGIWLIICLLAVGIGYGSRPLRMDYNLFFRASQNMLEISPAETFSSETPPRLNKSQLLTFARFLGSRGLIVDCRWESRGLKLRLPPVKPAFWNHPGAWYSIFRRQYSSLTLEWNGSISAQLGDKDERALLVLSESASPASSHLQEQVTACVESAWRYFRQGDAALAEHALGA